MGSAITRPWVGEVLGPHRKEFVLASKCGLTNGDKRELNGRPEILKATCEGSLKRLGTDVIDLYYLHRWDKRVPIEESVGALSELVAEGKIKTIGLSEVSAATLRKAHAVHPIAAPADGILAVDPQSGRSRCWTPVASWARLSWRSVRWDVGSWPAG